MYKALGAFLLFLLLLVGSAFLLLFTNSGNTLLKPYINSYISKNYKGLDAHVVSFTLRPNFLDVEAYIYKNIRVILNGDIDIYKRDMNLDFMVDAKNISTKFTKIKGEMKLKGKIKGDIKHIKIVGGGKIFDSKVDFDTNVDEYKVKNLHLKMNKARISKLLALIDKPPFVSGITNIDISLDDLNPKDLKGYVNIEIPYGSVNTILVNQELNVTLPAGFIFKTKSQTDLKGQTTISKLSFDSNIFKLNSSKILFDIKDKTLDSDYTLIIPRLNLLRGVIDQNLKGSFKATGRVKKEGKDVSYLISTFSFGGDLKVIGYNDKIQIDGNGLNVDKILYKLGLPRYFYGDINLKVYADNLKDRDINADINATIDNGRLNGEIFKKDFNISVPNGFRYKVDYNAHIKDKNLMGEIDINSSILSAKISKIKTSMDTLKTQGDYSLYILDLSKLYFVTKQKLYTDLNTTGDFEYFDKIFLLNGKTDLFNTATTYTYKNGDININAKNIDTKYLLSSFGYPAFFEAKGEAVVFYNPKWKKGNFKVTLNDGKIIKNELSDTVYMLSGFDLTKEIYQDSLLQGTVQGDMIRFVYDMNSTNTSLKIYDAYVDIKKQSIDAPFLIKIKGKDIQGEIKGDLHHPKVQIKTSSYIKNRIEKAIEKKVPKKFQEPLKQILNLFGG